MRQDKVEFHNEKQEGYGPWNEKVVGKPTQFCSLCDDGLDVYYKNNKAVWTKGHNAEPLNEEEDDRCCNYCNDTKVIPARLYLAAYGELPFHIKQKFLNEDSVNPIKQTMNRLNKLMEDINNE